MPVPSDPTLNAIVGEALKRGGIVSPTSSQLADAITHQLQEVKTDIALLAGNHPLLRTTAVRVCTVGRSRYPQPADANTLESIQLWDAADARRGTAGGGTAMTITLAPGFDPGSIDPRGRFIVLTGGTGAEQYRQITAYAPTTRTATVDQAWTTIPDTTTTYAVIDTVQRLYESSSPVEWDYLAAPFSLAMPRRAAVVSEEIWLDTAPDRPYLLFITYWVDLDRLDESGALFIKLLREWRSIWIEGIAAKVMDRYDDDRAPAQLAKYNALLANLAAKSSRVGQVTMTDVI